MRRTSTTGLTRPPRQNVLDCVLIHNNRLNENKPIAILWMGNWLLFRQARSSRLTASIWHIVLTDSDWTNEAINKLFLWWRKNDWVRQTSIKGSLLNDKLSMCSSEQLKWKQLSRIQMISIDCHAVNLHLMPSYSIQLIRTQFIPSSAVWHYMNTSVSPIPIHVAYLLNIICRLFWFVLLTSIAWRWKTTKP